MLPHHSFFSPNSVLHIKTANYKVADIYCHLLVCCCSATLLQSRCYILVLGWRPCWTTVAQLVAQFDIGLRRHKKSTLTKHLDTWTVYRPALGDAVSRCVSRDNHSSLASERVLQSTLWPFDVSVSSRNLQISHNSPLEPRSILFYFNLIKVPTGSSSVQLLEKAKISFGCIIW